MVISSYSAWRFTPYAGVAYSASKSALAAVCQTIDATRQPTAFAHVICVPATWTATSSSCGR